MKTQIRKPLLFGPPFPHTLFTGEKYKTYRVTGGERYSPGDLLSLCIPDLQEFAQATLVSKIRKTFAELTESDWQGHEKFKSEEEMFQIYSNWSRFQVTPTTYLDILQYADFKVTNPNLIKQLSQSQPLCTSEVTEDHGPLGKPTYEKKDEPSLRSPVQKRY